MEAEASLSSYRIFNTVAETGNLSSAAKELLISQPAISKAVSRLEQALSVKLFVRKSHGVKLTEEGSILYEYTCSAFESLRLGEECVKKLHISSAGSLRIGVSEMLCRHMLLPCLQTLQQRNESVPSVECLPASVLSEDLRKGALSLLLSISEEKSPEITFIPIRRTQFVFVALTKEISSLNNGAPVFSSPDASVRKTIQRKLSIPGQGFLPFTEKGVASTDVLLEFVRLGMGIGYVLRDLVQKELTEGSLTELLSEEPPEEITIGFSYLTKNQDNQNLQRFISLSKGRI